MTGFGMTIPLYHYLLTTIQKVRQL
jgi:hypothetical protein